MEYRLNGERILPPEIDCDACMLSVPCCGLEEDQRQVVCTSTDCDFDPFLFCCDDESHLVDLPPCEGGPTCPSASFVGWDVDCEECAEMPVAVAGGSTGRLEEEKCQSCSVGSNEDPGGTGSLEYRLGHVLDDEAMGKIVRFSFSRGVAGDCCSKPFLPSSAVD